MFCKKAGLPRESFPRGWKGQNRLYAAGLTKRGLLGTSIDSRRIAEDIEHEVTLDVKKSSKGSLII